MPRFYPLRIQYVLKETEDCVSLTFEVPDSIQPFFNFKPGQHLTLRSIIGGEEVRRTYSICSSPKEAQLKVAIKKLPGGKFSVFANENLRPGDKLDVMPPTGNFTVDLHLSNPKNYVAFAAGSGITPVISILKSVLQTEPSSSFTLFYGNRRAKSIIFKDEIEGLKNRYMDRLSVYYFLSQENPGSELFHGRISKEKCQIILKKLVEPSEIDEYFICGPAGMIDEVRETLTSFGIAKNKIHFELFTSPSLMASEKESGWEPPVNAIISKITITIDGKTFTFNQTSSGSPILDAAQLTGTDLPYACKGGVCCTCKAKILKGKAEMEVNYGLEADEVKAGYVLTCQAHPVTDEVVLTFDL